MDPASVEDLEVMQQQLLIFAQDVRAIVAEERVQRDEARAALRELQAQQLGVIRTLAFVCEQKDHHTRDHLDRTYQYAMQLTQRLAPDLAAQAAVGYGFLLHDIGKVLIPDAILNKPGPLEDDEWAVMRTHPTVGAQLVKPITFMGDAIGIIKQHHERWDGRGYPDKVAGEEIYLGARIFSVIDTFDAMTSDRPYRKGLSVHQAMEEIDRQSGTQFDPEVVTCFLNLCKELQVDATGEADSLSFVR